MLAGYGAAGSSSGDRADGYTAPVKEKRLCRKPVKDKSRERLAKQPKVSEESLREGMSLEASPAVVVRAGESSSSEEVIQPSTRGLERMSVTPAAWSDYKLRVEQAIAYLEQMQVKVEDDASLEAGLVTYMTEQFFRSAEAHEGVKLFAGRWVAFPEFYGAHLRCDMAVWTLVCFSTYLRLKEAFGLRHRDLIPPRAGIADHWALLIAPREREHRTRTGDFDDRVWRDTPCLKGFGLAIEILKEGPADSPLWELDYPELRAMFARSALELRFKAVPYQPRHAGPSWDRLRQLRSAEALRKRGQWRSQQPGVRYEMHARVAAEHQEYNAAQVVHFDTCARLLEARLPGCGVPPAVPPQ